MVKARAKGWGIKMSEGKLAQQQKAHKTEKVEQNCIERGQEWGAGDFKARVWPEGMALGMLDVGGAETSWDHYVKTKSR